MLRSFDNLVFRSARVPSTKAAAAVEIKNRVFNQVNTWCCAWTSGRRSAARPETSATRQRCYTNVEQAHNAMTCTHSAELGSSSTISRDKHNTQCEEQRKNKLENEVGK